MSVRLHAGHWTIFAGERPVIWCCSKERADELLAELMGDARD